MACYRSGGCGPYEMRACNECPASKESYLTRNTKTSDNNEDSDIKHKDVESKKDNHNE